MTLEEVIDKLNPVTTNKYTHYKSRPIKWAFDVRGWYTGDTSRLEVRLCYFSGIDRIYIGTVSMLNEKVQEIIVSKDTRVGILQELQQNLPAEIPIQIGK